MHTPVPALPFARRAHPRRVDGWRTLLAVLALLLATLPLAAQPAVVDPLADPAMRAELEQLNREFAQMIGVRERLAVKMIALQRELSEAENLLAELGELEMDVQTRINSLSGLEMTTSPRLRTLPVWEWAILILGAVVILIVFKIRLSRLRDQRRLRRLREALAKSAQ